MFHVYNLYLDYVFLGKIRRGDIEVTGAPEENKHDRIDIALHALDGVLEGATWALDQNRQRGGHVRGHISLSGRRAKGYAGTVLSWSFMLSNYAKAGYWSPHQGETTDELGNERYHKW